MTMFTSLQGGALWATVAVVIAVLGSATALAWQGVLTGSDWLAVAAPVLTGGAAIGGAHVANQAAARRQILTPGQVSPQSDPSVPAPGVGTSAMAPPA